MRRTSGILQRRHDVEGFGIAIGILALRRAALAFSRSLPPVRYENSSKQAVGRGDSDSLDQDFAQVLTAHGRGVRGAKQRDDLVDEAEIVPGENTEGIADDIIEAALLEIEIDVPGLLLGALLVQQAPRDEFAGTGFSRDRPGSPTTAGGSASSRPHAPWHHSRSPAAPCRALRKRFEHPRGFLAAGDAEIEPCLALVRDRIRIVVAIIAALAAVLLRHRGHHPPPQRTAVGELHAVCDRHGLVVPGASPSSPSPPGPSIALVCSGDSGVSRRGRACRPGSHSAIAAAGR